MKIKSLRLENFRAIASAYHVFDGKNAAIYFIYTFFVIR